MPNIDDDHSTMHAHKFLAALSQEEAFKAMMAHIAMRGLDPQQARIDSLYLYARSCGLKSVSTEALSDGVNIGVLATDVRGNEYTGTGREYRVAFLRAAISAGIELNGKQLTEADL